MNNRGLENEPLLGVKVFDQSGKPALKYYRFDGETFVADLDAARLSKQIDRVYSILKEGGWFTLRSLSSRVQAPESSVSARLRDLRKKKFGSNLIERRRVRAGLWEYRLNGTCKQQADQPTFF